MFWLDVVGKWLDLSWKDRGLVLHVACFLILFRVVLSRVSFDSLRSLIVSCQGPNSLAHQQKTVYQRRVGWAVPAVGSRILGPDSCLIQALTGHWLLRRRGLASTIQIGVARETNEELVAHAWVEWEGHIVIGGVISPKRYVRLEDIRIEDE